jgi:hypothetical protein
MGARSEGRLMDFSIYDGLMRASEDCRLYHLRFLRASEHCRSYHLRKAEFLLTMEEYLRHSGNVPCSHRLERDLIMAKLTSHPLGKLSDEMRVILVGNSLPRI